MSCALTLAAICRTCWPARAAVNTTGESFTLTLSRAVCSAPIVPKKARHITNLDNGALYALRHICLAEDKKLFGFKISPESLQELSRTSEQYTLAHLEHGLKSLDFLKSVLE